MPDSTPPFNMSDDSASTQILIAKLEVATAEISKLGAAVQATDSKLSQQSIDRHNANNQLVKSFGEVNRVLHEQDRRQEILERSVGEITTAVKEMGATLSSVKQAILGDEAVGADGLLRTGRELKKRVDCLESEVRQWKFATKVGLFLVSALGALATFAQSMGWFPHKS